MVPQPLGCGVKTRLCDFPQNELNTRHVRSRRPTASAHTRPIRPPLPTVPTGCEMRLLLLAVMTDGVALATSVAAAAATPVLLYVDPCQERLHVLPAAEARGCEVLLLHSAAAASAILEDEAEGEMRERVESNRVPVAGEELAWAREVLPLQANIVGVLCGSDGGLSDAERLQAVLVGERSNGCNAARRDKYLMLEALRAHGLAAPLQCSPASWAETEAFLEGHCRYPVVLKPRRGQASVLVGLARSKGEAQSMDEMLRAPKCHASIDTSELKAGDGNVVVQEYLEGEEFVVDTVSRAGEHKCLALWRYDKGPANGAPFVYFADELRGCAGPREARLVEYAFRVLDSLGWQWGPCHIEVKWAARGAGGDGGGVEGGDGGGAEGSSSGDGSNDGGGPVLVEINAGRWNGVDFHTLVSVCTGHDAYEATLDAYLDKEAWEALPSRPPAVLRGHGRLVKLVSSVSGTLVAPPEELHAEALAGLPSLLHFETEANAPGDTVTQTVDLASCAGYAHLLHADEAVVERDYQTLRQLQPRMFAVQPEPRPET
jgi:D-alanine-D-alanine ligase-like ATP-grasp enzyme